MLRWCWFFHGLTNSAILICMQRMIEIYHTVLEIAPPDYIVQLNVKRPPSLPGKVEGTSRYPCVTDLLLRSTPRWRHGIVSQVTPKSCFTARGWPVSDIFSLHVVHQTLGNFLQTMNRMLFYQVIYCMCLISIFFIVWNLAKHELLNFNHEWKLKGIMLGFCIQEDEVSYKIRA